MDFRTLLLSFSAAMLFASCASSDAPSPEVLRRAESRAALAADKLMGALIGELTDAMTEGGPVHAVQYCADHAQEVTARISREQGVVMRRITDRTRNSASSPAEYEEPILRRFAELREGGKLTPESVVVETRMVDGRPVLLYTRPLTIKKKCLTCHGSSGDVPAEVAAVIAERYPGDRATGYREGDFRGAISVTVPLDE